MEIEVITQITCEQLRIWGACYYNYGRKDPAEVDAQMRAWMGGDSVTPLEALDLEAVPVDDRIWVATRPGVLSERWARHLACDFAEHVLPLYEGAYPDDRRPRTAIEVARRYADGNATEEELRAALAAARAAARDAARAAARAAAWDARSATWCAERAAAWDARSATWCAERGWQLERCRHYLRLQTEEE